MNNKAFVYLIRHIETGEAYVGCTTKLSERWARHRYLLRHSKHHSVRLQSLWDREGEASFAFEVVEELLFDGKPEQVSAELRWIEESGTLNTHISGGTHFTLREEDADKRRDAQMALLLQNPELLRFRQTMGAILADLAKTPEAREQMSEQTKIRWQIPDEAAKMRAGLVRRWEDPTERERAAERGRNASKKLRRQRADSLTATWADPERNQTLMESRKKRWADPEAKERQAAKMRAIWAQRRAEKA
jgi:hypothetical protein